MKNITHFNEKLVAEKKALEEELTQIARFNTDTNVWEATPDQDMMGRLMRTMQQIALRILKLGQAWSPPSKPASPM